jgi:sugar phosphate isomerase/epimerase
MDERISIVTDEISRDLAEVRTFLDEHRLDAVELRCVGDGRVPDLSASDRATLRSWAAAADPVILGVSPGTFKCRHDDRAAIRRDLTETLPRAIDLARDLRAHFLVTFSFETLGEPLDPFAVEALREAADACAAVWLPLLVENEPGFGAQTGADLVRLLGEAGRENLFVNWDPLNSNELDGPRLAAALDAVFHHVGHVHVKNGVLGPGERFARCGPLADGDIDWPAHLAHLAALGYDGYLGVETHYEPCREGSAVVLAELRGMLARLREDEER